jgi:ABC-2 type transport system ATP-binding protein
VTLPVRTAGLTKRYGKVVAIDDLSLTVAPGEVVGLLGPNGAGKSTTVKTLVGLVHATAGSAELFGVPSDRPEARRHVGYLPELFRFHEWMTGRQLLAFHGELAGIGRDQLAAGIPDVLNRVGLANRADERIGGYSKGMAQRIGLAQAIIGSPRLVILDEPTSALDPVGRREVRDLIRDLRSNGTAILLNSHLLGEVEQVCDRVAVIDRGRLVFEGDIGELTGGAHRLEVRVERLSGELVTALGRFGDVTVTGADTVHVDAPDLGLAADIADLVVSTGHRLLALTPIGRNLEEAFTEMVDGGDR